MGIDAGEMEVFTAGGAKVDIIEWWELQVTGNFHADKFGKIWLTGTVFYGLVADGISGEADTGRNACNVGASSCIFVGVVVVTTLLGCICGEGCAGGCV